MATATTTAANETMRGQERAAGMQQEQREQQEVRAAADFARRLREETAAVRMRRRVLGNSRSLNAERRKEIATIYGADPQFLRASKKLLNRKDPRIRECFAICDRAIKYWESMTVPYSEAAKGLRLIRRDRIDEFDKGMNRLLDELSEATATAEEVYQSEILPEARERLQELFDASDYPPTLVGCWGFDWEYPNVEPPRYLQQLNPELYEQEQRRVAARFDEAVQLAEQHFIEQFSAMIARLAERLTPAPDGTVKTFQESTLGNLREFFERFRELNIGSNQELDQLVDEAQQALSGVDAKGLRKDTLRRQTVGESMQEISQRLEALMTDRPARKISLEESDD